MTERLRDTNGFYEIKRNPISRVGVYPYMGRSIGADEPDRVYRVLRPPEELGHPDCINSFRLMPIVDDHTMLGEGAGLMATERKGAHGTIGDEVIFDGDTLYGNIKIWSTSLDGKITKGKRELSCGYRCSYDFTPGTWQGQEYDVIQRQMRGNHLALVDRGRMGPDVRVLDQWTYDGMELQGMDPELKAYLDSLRAGMDTALAGIPALIAAAVTPAVQSAVDAAITGMDADEETAGMSEDEKTAFFAKKKEDADKATADAITDQVKKAVDSAMAAHKVAAPAAMDAKEIGAAISRKTVLAERLAQHVGTFDHSAMDELDVAKYGLDKLGLKDVEDAAAVVAVKTWLDVKPLPAAVHRRDVAASGSTATVDAYLTPAE